MRGPGSATRSRGLALLLGHGLPAAQTARDSVDVRRAGPAASGRWQVGGAGGGVGLARRRAPRGGSRRKSGDDRLDATIVASSKRAAAPCYAADQPVVALGRAGRDRGRRVPRRQCLCADRQPSGDRARAGGLPGAVERVYLRADSALYASEVFLDRRKVGFAISPVSPGLMRRMPGRGGLWSARTKARCVIGRCSTRPDGAIDQPEGVVRRLLRHPHQPQAGFAVCRRRGGQALLRRHQSRRPAATPAIFCAGTAARPARSSMPTTLANELAAAALPSQKSARMRRGSASTWCSTTLSAFKRLGLPEALQRIRPKRLRFLVLNTLARLICHARERLLRFADGFARSVLDRFRVRIHAHPPPLEADPLRRPSPRPARPGPRTLTAVSTTAAPRSSPPSRSIQDGRHVGPPMPKPQIPRIHHQRPPEPADQRLTRGMVTPTGIEPVSPP